MWITKFGNTNKKDVYSYKENKMTTTVNIDILGMIYENGTSEVLVITPRQWAQKCRNKKWKSTIISKSKLASLNLKIKTK